MRENNYYFDGPVTADRVLDALQKSLLHAPSEAINIAIPMQQKPIYLAN